MSKHLLHIKCDIQAIEGGSNVRQVILVIEKLFQLAYVITVRTPGSEPNSSLNGFSSCQAIIALR